MAFPAILPDPLVRLKRESEADKIYISFAICIGDKVSSPDVFNFSSIKVDYGFLKEDFLCGALRISL